MSLLVIFLTAIGLSMDAFAAALASGVSLVNSRARHALRVGLAFGLAQMVMPILGWFLGSKLKHLIVSFDHWIAFCLLLFIGLKMLKESFSGNDCVKEAVVMSNSRLLFLAVATSVDALAVGVTFAFLDSPVWLASFIIGVVTFFISAMGAIIGCFCCCVWGRRAERFGGLVLIFIGVKILLEHLFG